MAASGSSRFARPVAFMYPAFTLYQVARFCIVLATEMQSVAVGWQVYDITKRPLDLGLVGLAQFLPGILLFLVSGHAADRYDRRRVLTLGYAGFAMCSGLLLAITIFRPNTVYPIYAVVALVGVVRSFNAQQAAQSCLSWCRTNTFTARSPGAPRFSRQLRFWGQRSVALFMRSFEGRRLSMARRWWLRRVRLFRCLA